MKVYIGPYRDRWRSNIHDRYMRNKYGYNNWPENQSKFENALEKLEDALQWLYNHTINLILDKRKDQIINVKIHNYDTWSMDHTLAHIIVPMLKQLKETKHGVAMVDLEDVPEELRIEDRTEEIVWMEKRWDWVMDEMIWAFEQKLRDDWTKDYYVYEDDPKEQFGLKIVSEDRAGAEAHQQRMSRGFILFGKYYEALWD